MTKNKTTIVNEGEYSFTKSESLYTTELYSCVALYALSEDFGYLAHILVEDSNEFNILGVDKVNALYDYIEENANKENHIYIGLVYGVWKDPILSDKYEVIEEELEEKIEYLINNNFKIEELETTSSEYVNIDFKAKEISLEYEYHDLSDVQTSNQKQK